MKILLTALVFSSVTLWLPAQAAATDLQIARLANQLSLASLQFAEQLGGNSDIDYSRVQSSARQLGQEASELVDAVRNKRSRGDTGSAFNAVVRHYYRLEENFLRAFSEKDSALISEARRISELYAELNAEYRISYGQRAYPYQRPELVERPGRQPGSPYPTLEDVDQLDSGRRSATRQPLFDHGSAVLERQSRQDARQRRLDDILERRHGDLP